ncbi:MAG: hypothetical protein AABZ47_14570 [Planctomycetota bacterium]
MTIEFKAIEFRSTQEAVQWTEAGECGVAILLDGKNYVMDRAEVERIEVAGVEFAYLNDYEMPNGEHRIITVPVND